MGEKLVADIFSSCGLTAIANLVSRIVHLYRSFTYILSEKTNFRMPFLQEQDGVLTAVYPVCRKIAFPGTSSGHYVIIYADSKYRNCKV